MNDTQKIVELSKPIMGRRKIKMVLHEIYSDTIVEKTTETIDTVYREILEQIRLFP